MVVTVKQKTKISDDEKKGMIVINKAIERTEKEILERVNSTMKKEELCYQTTAQ